MRRAGRTEKEERPFPSLADRRSEPEKAEHVQRQTGRKAGTQSQEAKAEGNTAMPVRLPHTYNCLRNARKENEHVGKNEQEGAGPSHGVLYTYSEAVWMDSGKDHADMIGMELYLNNRESSKNA